MPQIKRYSRLLLVSRIALYRLFLLIAGFLSSNLLIVSLFTPTNSANFFSTSSFAAENRDRAQQELETVATAIEEIQSWLLDAHEQQSREEKRLQSSEEELAAVSQAVSESQQALTETESELGLLRIQAARLETEKTEQDEVLAQALRAAYMAGEASPIKLLLNQENISDSARMLHYHRLFSASQIEKIAAFQSTLAEITEVDDSLQSKAEELLLQQNELQQQVLALFDAKADREQAMASLEASISTRGSELEQLEINQVELQQLIEQINQSIARIPAAAEGTPFADQRGKLLLPVEGPVISSFGARYGDGDLRRQGITIGVSEGTAVQAIHPGRIVFSDWLRGSGLLVIVDHGEGYMSLYGANQALSRQAGEWVNSGDMLATSGGGSAQNPASIYFEIRLHGEAQNPASWIDLAN